MSSSAMEAISNPAPSGDQDLQDARIGIGLDGEVRAHARERGLEAARLGLDDVQVDQQDGLLVGVLREVLLEAREVEADFRMGIEGELGLRAQPLYRGGSGHRGLGRQGMENKRGATRAPGEIRSSKPPGFLAPVMMTSSIPSQGLKNRGGRPLSRPGIRKKLREV